MHQGHSGQSLYMLQGYSGLMHYMQAGTVWVLPLCTPELLQVYSLHAPGILWPLQGLLRIYSFHTPTRDTLGKCITYSRSTRHILLASSRLPLQLLSRYILAQSPAVCNRSSRLLLLAHPGAPRAALRLRPALLRAYSRFTHTPETPRGPSSSCPAAPPRPPRPPESTRRARIHREPVGRRTPL